MAINQGDETERNIEDHKGYLCWDTSNMPPNYPVKVKSSVVKVKSANFKWKIQEHRNPQEQNNGEKYLYLTFDSYYISPDGPLLFYSLYFPDFPIFCNAQVLSI